MFRPFFRIYLLGRFLKEYTSSVISLELELDAMFHATDNVETVPVCVTGTVLKIGLEAQVGDDASSLLLRMYRADMACQCLAEWYGAV